MEKIFLDSYVFLDVILGTDKKGKAIFYLKKVQKKNAIGVIDSLCLLEIKYHVMRKLGHEKGEDACYFIKSFPNLEILPVSSELAEHAADIRFAYYDKKNRALSFADAVHISAAIKSKCSKIVSGEQDFAELTEIKSEIY